MTRIQRRRTKGWRMPPGAVYVGRPSKWGNPWPLAGEMQPWLALALGQRGDEPGRRQSAIIAYRWWMRNDGSPFPVPGATPGPGDIEYTDGSTRHISDVPVAMGVFMLGRKPIGLPEPPDIEPLRRPRSRLLLRSRRAVSCGRAPGASGVTPVLAIDPGPLQSAWLMFADGKPTGFGIEANDALIRRLRTAAYLRRPWTVVIEQIRSFGMAVGAEVFDTVHWSGRFHEAAGELPVVLLPRLEVKKALCHDSRAKDANIRQALLDRFGGTAAIGRKASPGPLYGVSRDVWSALALAVTYSDGAA